MASTNSTVLFSVGAALLLGWARVKNDSGKKHVDFAAHFKCTKPTDWNYIAEGALNLALKYVGTDPVLEGFVLRLRKNNPKASGGKRSADPWTESTKFCENIMVPLLGRRYVQASRKVPVTSAFIKELDAHILQSRPEKRRKFPLDEMLRYGLLMVDNTGLKGVHKGPAMCVELKVKCGFVPTSPFITHQVKKRIDRFQLHQQLKFAEGDLDTVSKYSPPDLFSRDITRVKNAIKNLLETPQNNFRLFLDGKMVFPDSKGHGSKAELFKILSQYKDIPAGPDGFVDTLADLLVYEPLVDRIRKVQELDEADIEAVWPVYQEILNRGEEVLPLAEGDAIHPREPIKELPKTPAEQHDLVRRFLLSCTAKDCSVMIVMQPDGSNADSVKRKMLVDLPVKVDPEEPRTVVKNFNGFSYSIAVVDLDPKPFQKMEHWFEVDKRIAEHYTAAENANKLH